MAAYKKFVVNFFATTIDYTKLIEEQSRVQTPSAFARNKIK